MSTGKEREENTGAPEADQSAGSPTEPSHESSGTAAQAASDAPALAEQLAALQAEKEELRQTLIRRQADFENYRKRIERERHTAGHSAMARFIESLLPVLDGFERALAAHDDPAYEDYRKGLELIYRQLWDALARQGLERIEAEGRRFDPHLHHAVERVESETQEDGEVLEVLQPGYRLRDRVLRPASVRVAVHPSGKRSEAPKTVN